MSEETDKRGRFLFAAMLFLLAAALFVAPLVYKWMTMAPR